MKFYRAKTSSFLWEKGAILKPTESGNGYKPINDIWDVTENQSDEYISKQIIENNPEHFERVHEVNGLTKKVYMLKHEARELMSKNYSSPNNND